MIQTWFFHHNSDFIKTKGNYFFDNNHFLYVTNTGFIFPNFIYLPKSFNRIMAKFYIINHNFSDLSLLYFLNAKSDNVYYQSTTTITNYILLKQLWI